jgi:uncharacterized protein YwqG
MSFWKKLFSKKEAENKTVSPLEGYSSDANESEPTTSSDLENLVAPLIRPATKIKVLPASRPAENSQLNSHFGGQPYFEHGEKWPTTKNDKPLDFIFQVFNSPDLQLPKDIELIQFYYDFDEYPWDTADDGWLVKIYKKIQKENIQLTEKPTALNKSRYCEIIFEAAKSLPDWDGILIYNQKVLKLSASLNSDKPWDNYQQVVTKLIGEQDFQSQLGGYPKWIQGNGTPDDAEGNPMELLFQLDSEENAGLMWGDVGLVYVFYDGQTGQILFSLQCH